MATPERLKIIDSDRMHGTIVIHFSNGMAVQYQAQFLWDARNLDGNIALAQEPADDGTL